MRYKVRGADAQDFGDLAAAVYAIAITDSPGSHGCSSPWYANFRTSPITYDRSCSVARDYSGHEQGAKFLPTVVRSAGDDSTTVVMTKKREVANDSWHGYAEACMKGYSFHCMHKIVHLHKAVSIGREQLEDDGMGSAVLSTFNACQPLAPRPYGNWVPPNTTLNVTPSSVTVPGITLNRPFPVHIPARTLAATGGTVTLRDRCFSRQRRGFVRSP